MREIRAGRKVDKSKMNEREPHALPRKIHQEQMPLSVALATFQIHCRVVDCHHGCRTIFVLTEFVESEGWNVVVGMALEEGPCLSWVGDHHGSPRKRVDFSFKFAT